MSSITRPFRRAWFGLHQFGITSLTAGSSTVVKSDISWANNTDHTEYFAWQRDGTVHPRYLAKPRVIGISTTGGSISYSRTYAVSSGEFNSPQFSSQLSLVTVNAAGADVETIASMALEGGQQDMGGSYQTKRACGMYFSLQVFANPDIAHPFPNYPTMQATYPGILTVIWDLMTPFELNIDPTTI